MGHVRWDIVEEHLDEAAFLWADRRIALSSYDYRLDEVAEGPEARFLANIDGLVLVGEAVRDELLVGAVADDDPDRVAAAAYAATALGEDGLPWLVDACDLNDDALRATVVGSLGTAGNVPEETIVAHAKSEDPAVAALGFGLAAMHRLDVGALAEDGLRHESAAVRISAVYAAQYGPAHVVERAVASAMRDADEGVRRAGIDVGLVTGQAEAWRSLPEWLDAPDPNPEWWLVAAVSTEELLRRVLGAARSKPDAAIVRALGFSGRAEALDICASLLTDDRLAPVAAQSISMACGLDLVQLGLVVRREDGEALPALEEEDLDADLVPGPEDELPWPNADAVASKWAATRRSWPPNVRHVYGAAFDDAALLGMLRDRVTREREGWALEVAIKSQGRFVVDTWALTAKQRAQLSG